MQQLLRANCAIGRAALFADGGNGRKPARPSKRPRGPHIGNFLER